MLEGEGLMPFSTRLDNLPAGYAVNAAVKGDRVHVAVREFVSSEDGHLFIERLEGLPQGFLDQLPPNFVVLPSTIDNMLAIITADKTATLYVNELEMRIKTRTKKSVGRGEPVRIDDIATIEALEFVDVEVPPDAGLLFLFSMGWRKGMYYDLAPLHGERAPRDYDLSLLLGYYYAYLSNQEFFNIDDELWEELFRTRWFPFITLSKGLRKKLLSHVSGGWELSDLLDEVALEVGNVLDDMSNRWQNSYIFEPHMPLLGHALDEYREGDYKSSASIIYPRIEGVLRTAQQSLANPPRANYQEMLDASVGKADQPPIERSLLLPKRFRRFMEEVYLADFEPGKRAGISRHSVAHGVADPAEFDQKGATLGLLILDQLFFFLPSSPIG